MGDMTEALDSRVNTRVPRRMKNDLAALSRRQRVDESELARRLLDEAIRREKHPTIVFRSASGGREAAIEGRRLYVWQVIETLRASGGEVDEAAEYLGIRPDQVRSAAAYHAEHAAEIDELIELNHEAAEQAQRIWSPEQQGAPA